MEMVQGERLLCDWQQRMEDLTYVQYPPGSSLRNDAYSKPLVDSYAVALAIRSGGQRWSKSVLDGRNQGGTPAEARDTLLASGGLALRITIAETVFYRGNDRTRRDASGFDAAEQDPLLYSQLHAVEQLGYAAGLGMDYAFRSVDRHQDRGQFLEHEAVQYAESTAVDFLSRLYQGKTVRRNSSGPVRTYPNARGPLARALFYFAEDRVGDEQGDYWISRPIEDILVTGERGFKHGATGLAHATVRCALDRLGVTADQ